MYFKLYLVLVLSILFTSTVGFDPISIGSVIVGSGASIGKYLLCSLNECCNQERDFDKLKSELNSKVFGQHLAVNVINDAIKSHWDYKDPQKALAISLHGSTGVGKNYITNFIKESLFKKASDSKFVHHFNARIHFPLENNVETYKSDLYNWIKSNVSACPYQLFIFDEVDKIPVGLFDILKPIISYNARVDRIDFRKCIFIFLSNTGGSIIINKLLQFWEQGKSRDDLSLHDFKREISQGAFNEEGGFQFSATIESNLIDHYIPFLPLELSHVKACIKDEFVNRKFTADDDDIEEVLKYIDWGPAPYDYFAITGCRGVYAQVGAYAARKNRNG